MKLAIKAFISGFVCLSVLSTVTGRVLWPICPYNMFSFFLDVRNPVLEAELLNPGKDSCRSKISGLLPFEFFRANQIIKRNLFDPKFQRALRAGLTQTWSSFDEVHSPTACLADGAQDIQYKMVIQ